MPVKKISANEIEIGMYITSLDRPWSETPFLFQGFEVKTTEELADLQRLAKHVYIAVPDEEIKLTSIPSNRTGDVPRQGMLGEMEYEILQSAEDEVVAVRESHEEIVDLIGDIETIVNEDQELQLDQMDASMNILVKSVTSNPDAFIWLTQIKKFDSYIYRDALNCSVWATALGRKLGISEQNLKKLATGALLMDLGKTALPKSLIHKRTHLDRDEWEQMKTHVGLGLDILENSSDMGVEVMDIVRTHHERLDGSGYPKGLRGREIPLFGQIAGIVDFYVSVTNSRPFAPVISPSMAIDMLYEQRVNYFNEMLVQNFIHVISTYPTGSLVELSNGDIAVVISQNPGLKLRPNVVLLLDRNKQPYGLKPIINLMSETNDMHGNQLSIVKTLADGTHGLCVEDLPV